MSLFSQGMNRLIAATWWVVLLRGLAAIGAGLLLIFRPDASLLLLTLFFGGYLFVSGIFSLVGAFLQRQGNPRWWLDALIGLFGVLIGLFVLFNPTETLQMTPTLLTIILAGVVLLLGVLEIVKGLTLRTPGHWANVALGVIYLISAVLLLLFSNLTIGILVYSFIFLLLFIGVVLIYYAFSLRKLTAD